MVNEEALERLDKKKSDHKDILALFRSDFDAFYKKEKHIKQEMKGPKLKLKNLINVSPLFKNILTSDDVLVLKKNVNNASEK
jgi:biotin synthase-like enzyme